MTVLRFGLSLAALAAASHAFVGTRRVESRMLGARFLASSTTTTIEFSLTKPLGLILEEVEEGQAQGVLVAEVAEAGSAAPYKEALIGQKLATVQGTDVTLQTFDQVMELLVEAPETVDLTVQEAPEPPKFPDGSVVTIKYKQSGQDDMEISAKVGDNLRKVLLDNGVEVYQGLKQKLGNCGGAGQCTFCAMDVLESEGWLERSEYEDDKLRKNPAARLSCLNSIQGPATLAKAER